MEKENLCCLYKSGNGMFLVFGNIENLIKKKVIPEEALEIDLTNRKWRYMNQDQYIQSKHWSNIGEQSNGDKRVHIVFDPTDLSHLEKAFSIASHFYSNNYAGDSGDD